MPIYEYKCNECQQVFENWQTSFEEQEIPCPACQGSTVRIMSNTSFVLKGTGWYVTDYAGRKPSSSAPAKESGSDSSASSSENRKTDVGAASSSSAAAS